MRPRTACHREGKPQAANFPGKAWVSFTPEVPKAAGSTARRFISANDKNAEVFSECSLKQENRGGITER